MLKEKLLETNYFIDNTWLDKYIDLINQGTLTKAVDNYESHHIIPFCYFVKILNLKTFKEKDHLRKVSLKNSTDEYNLVTKNNIICLSFYRHCLAHWYLFNCTIGFLKEANEVAFIKMTDRDLKLRNCSEEEINQLLKNIKILENDPTSGRFKQKQIDKIIIENYPNGYKACQVELYTKFGYLWTKARIKGRAKTLGVKSKNYQPLWTEEEINILKENYPKFGYKI